MPNPYGAPEISVTQVAEKINNKEDFILLDVRESDELEIAAVLADQLVHTPLSKLAADQASALPNTIQEDQACEIVVMCRSGGRSAQVTAWLTQQGWTNVLNMDGGILAYSRDVDSSIPTY
jgi:adenylyltransferase/sulfurtransferase